MAKLLLILLVSLLVLLVSCESKEENKLEEEEKDNKVKKNEKGEDETDDEKIKLKPIITKLDKSKEETRGKINVKKPIISTEGTKEVTDKKACKQQCAKINPSIDEKKKEATNKQFSSIGLKINEKGECTCASMSLKLSFFVMGLALFIRR